MPTTAHKTSETTVRLFHETARGRILLGDSLGMFREEIEPGTVDLIMTSPPFGLVRKKDYGNADAHDYLEWFRPFAAAFHKALKPQGSLVIDIGGAWISGQPTRSLYHYELLIMLCKEFGFHLAQEFFWWNPARLPTPAEWVTVRRIRVKDAVNCIWWLSPTPWPKASNRRVLQPYSDSMKTLLAKGYKPMLRPSGHDISDCFGTDNGAAIPPNLISLAHTESNSAYIRYCRDNGITPHPARFPTEIPEFFIRMLTEVGDLVVDPFCGSCATGEAAERTRREWICCDLVEDYLKGARGRFQRSKVEKYSNAKSEKPNDEDSYRAVKPGLLWNGVEDDEPLAEDGGAKRVVRDKRTKPLHANAHPHEPKPAQMALLESYSPAQKRRKNKGK
ncbi:MAG TPA: site-specific DNA-methyltransferase [Verrucomicrobiota bacterium]|jgi:site-specific DNA-methyltransferase (cytosine-N4-specific)|nr:site-specific DNA-methyltransferase [Verrucomicrobiota bacterium]HQL77354.1 site-specific DNA-methyltransferase [Verrucomicrobiota bacterium]